MERTQIINTVGTEDEPGRRNWRRRLGKTQLLCPKCDEWFTLGKDFHIDEDGNTDGIVYHICDDDSDNVQSWVVLPQLVGWKS